MRDGMQRMHAHAYTHPPSHPASEFRRPFPLHTTALFPYTRARRGRSAARSVGEKEGRNVKVTSIPHPPTHTHTHTYTGTHSHLVKQQYLGDERVRVLLPVLQPSYVMP